VDGIVEGAVQRSGDHVRITAQLIHGASDKHLWARSYERETRDVFVLERDLAGDIARQVQARLTTAKQSQLAQPRPMNPKALEAYLQGNFYLVRGERSLSDEVKRKAAGYFQQAIDDDPTFVPAYIGLADSHHWLMRASREDWAIRRKAAQTALALDPSSSEALVILAWMKYQHDFDWAGAEQDDRRAVALNPNSASAHDDLGTVLGLTGRLDEALKESEIAQGLDPNEDHLADTLIMRRDYDRAVAEFLRLAEIHPGEGLFRYDVYWAYLADGKKKEAVQELERACTLWGFSELAANMHGAFAVSGYRGVMREWAKYLEHLHATNQGFLPEALAAAYAALGDKDRAFYWLDQAYTYRENVSHDWGLSILKANPLLDPLRSDPRYQALLRRIGLPP
jgi:tetratricopeptide (TPR) repeat protein